MEGNTGPAAAGASAEEGMAAAVAAAAAVGAALKASDGAADAESKALALEAEKAASRQKIAQAEKATAQAEVEKLTAGLTDAKTEAPKGEIKTDEKVGLVARSVAYSLALQESETIATEVAAALPEDARVLVVEDRDLAASDWSYRLIAVELKVFADALADARDALREARETHDQKRGSDAPAEDHRLRALGSPGLVGAAAVARGLVGTAADIAAFFRSDYSMSSTTVEIPSETLISSVAGHLVRLGKRVALDRFSVLEDSPLVDKFEAAIELRNTTKQLSDQLKGEVVGPAQRTCEALRALQAAKSAAASAAKETSSRNSLNEAAAEFGRQAAEVEELAGPVAGLTAGADALVSSFDSKVTEWVSASEGASPPLLLAVLREGLRGRSPRFTHCLYLKVRSESGEVLTKRSAWPRWSTATFVAGAELSYGLLDVAVGDLLGSASVPVAGRVRINLASGEIGGLERIVPRGAASPGRG